MKAIYTQRENNQSIHFYEEKLDLTKPIRLSPSRGEVVLIKGKHYRVAEIIHDIAAQQVTYICAKIPCTAGYLL